MISSSLIYNSWTLHCAFWGLRSTANPTRSLFWCPWGLCRRSWWWGWCCLASWWVRCWKWCLRPGTAFWERCSSTRYSRNRCAPCSRGSTRSQPAAAWVAKSHNSYRAVYEDFVVVLGEFGFDEVDEVAAEAAFWGVVARDDQLSDVGVSAVRHQFGQGGFEQVLFAVFALAFWAVDEVRCEGTDGHP